MPTTARIGDFLGRALRNPIPSTSNALDFLGRAVKAGDKDFLDRTLLTTANHPPPVWAATTAYSAGVRRRLTTNELQTVTITGTPDDGTFTLTYEGATTTAIAFNATAATVETALRALSTIGSENVSVGGGPGPGTPYTVTFQDALSDRNVSEMTAAHAFTGGTTPAIAVVTTTAGAPVRILEATVGGTSAGSVPTAPAVGATVVDATVTWKRLV